MARLTMKISETDPTETVRPWKIVWIYFDGKDEWVWASPYDTFDEALTEGIELGRVAVRRRILANQVTGKEQG